MSYRFRKHYRREEAEALLPRIRQWLRRLNELRHEVDRSEQRISSMMRPGHDVGGDLVNLWIRSLTHMQELLGEFHRREILIKDLARGLLDFPAVIDGKEVFLCWEQDEEKVEFWHDLDTGYGGRERLD